MPSNLRIKMWALKRQFRGRRTWLAAVAVMCICLFLLVSRHAQDQVTSADHDNMGAVSRSSQSHLLGEILGINHTNPHNYKYLINEQKMCSHSDHVTLAIFVSSSVSHFEERQAIRDTWGKKENLNQYNAFLSFLLGSTNDTSVQDKVKVESEKYHDILQEDFVDSYYNLTLKTVMALKWIAKYCPRTEYILKTDDDIYVNIPLLVPFLKKNGRPRWITGCIKQTTAPKPISLDGITPPQAHPLFTAGAGYVISGDIVRELYLASLDIRIIPVEDVYITAHCARAIGVHPPQHVRGFSCGEYVMDDCDMVQKYTGHKITPERQFSIWEKFSSEPNPCMDF